MHRTYITLILLLVLMVVVLLICSCQPTPEKPVVQSKANGEFEQALNGGATSSGDIGIPESIKVNFPAKTDTVTIEVDAHPTQVAISTVPISEYGQDEITTEFVKDIAAYFGGNEVYYKLPSILTKAQIMTEIKETEKVLDEDRLNREYGDNEEQKNFVRSIALIEYNKLKELYNDAPETVDKTPATFEFLSYVSFMNQAEYAKNYAVAKYFADRGDESAIREMKELESITDKSNSNNKLWCEGIATLPSGYACYVSAQKLNISNSSSCGISVRIGKALSSDGKPIEVYDSAFETKPLTISEDEAMAIAEKTVSELGFDDFSLAHMRKISEPGLQSYYSIIYRRQIVDGLCTVDFFMLTDEDISSALRPEYGTESISFIITDDGIVQFDLNCPLREIRTVNESVQLKAFDEVYEIFKIHCSIKYDNILDIEYDENGKNTVTSYADNTTVAFSGISLSTLRVIKKGETSIYYIIPVWVFEGEVEREQAVIGMENPEKYISQTAIMINAIDGTIISAEDCY